MQKHEAVQLPDQFKCRGYFLLSLPSIPGIHNGCFIETCYKFSWRHFSEEKAFCLCSYSTINTMESEPKMKPAGSQN